MTKEAINKELESLLKDACETTIGVIDSRFLCQSIGTLDPVEPLTVTESQTMKEVQALLKSNNIGCVVVVNAEGQISGIFSERDYMTSIAGNEASVLSSPVSEFMSPEPITAAMDDTIAFALTLMSEGGFRHVPIIDSEAVPTAILSVRDIVNFIVQKLTHDVMNFEVLDS